MKSFFAKILNLIFIEKCINCQKENEIICTDCQKEIKILQQEECLKDILSMYPYRNDIIHKAIWRLKYKNKINIGIFFGQKIFQLIEKNLSQKKIILLPIPLHQKNKRMYNQTSIISKGLKEKLDKNNIENYTIEDLIIRSKETERQAMIKDRKTRIQNMQNVFIFNPKYKELNKNTQIIIIDDITTTGQTLYDARRSLREANFTNILLVSVAH